LSPSGDLAILFFPISPLTNYYFWGIVGAGYLHASIP
jgi:hypothetical protein